MLYECNFNPDKDICEVVEGLAINLNSVIETGIVPSSGTDVNYNGIEAHDISGCFRVNDVFQAMDLQKRFGKAIMANTNQSPEKGEN